MAKKNKKHFSNYIVIASIIHIDLFIIALLVLHFTGNTFNDAAVNCYFAFWTVEIFALAGIKVVKTFKGDNL